MEYILLAYSDGIYTCWNHRQPHQKYILPTSCPIWFISWDRSAVDYY